MSNELKQPYYNVRAMHRWPHHVLNAISGTDWSFGGGSLLQMILLRLCYNFLIFLKNHGKPVIVYANGIGPPFRLGRFQHGCFNTVKDITVRDQESFKELKKIGVNKNTVTPDPACWHPGKEMTAF